MDDLDDSALLLKLLEAEAAYQLKSKDDNWYRGDLRFLCHAAQHIIYDKYYSVRTKETVMLCSRRFGKSFLSVILCLEFAIRNPGTITRFVPPEIKQAWQIVQPTFMKLEQSWPVGLVRYVASEKAWKIGKGSWLYLGGFDSQKDAARGGEASLIICDEAGFTDPENYEYIMKSVLKPQLLTTKGRIVIPSTPSRDPSHPFMTETVADAKLNGNLHIYTIHDNPLINAEQIEEAKRDCGGEDTEDWRREYMCEVVRSGSITVIPKWREEYVKEWEPNEYDYRVLVGDFGGVQDKTVIHAISYSYRSGVDGTVHFLDERVYEANTTTEDIVKGIRELHDKWIKPGKAPNQDQICYLDCPGQLRVDLNLQHNLVVQIPAKDEFHSGVNLLNIFVNRCRINIHPRCKFTVLSFDSARFNDKRTDYIRNSVLGHCDAIASAIYGIRMINKDSDGNPFDRKPTETHATWKQPSRSDDRFNVAAAIFNRRRD